jgi:hypothetical protein
MGLAKHAALSVTDKDNWDKWGERYVKRQPLQRTQITIESKPSLVIAKAKILQTIKAAGAEGTVVFNVGHGGIFGRGQSPRQGTVEIAPGGVMTIAGDGAKGFVDVFYDETRRGPKNTTQLEDDLRLSPDSPRLVNFGIYQEIARAFKTTGVRKVIFLSCNIGNSSEMLKKIARDWHVIVQTYTGKIEIDTIKTFNGANKLVNTSTMMFTQNNPPPYGSAADTIFHEEEIPFEPTQTVIFGPPL